MLMEQIIRVGQSRGAFQASEMVKIGVLYEKLSTILAKYTAEQEVITESTDHLPTILENEQQNT